MAKSLHLLHHGFTAKLEKLSSEIGRQIVAAQSESARHALAYGRYEEMLADSDSLLSNLQRVVQRAYDQHGRPVESDGGDRSSYVDSTLYMFRTYLMARDRDLRVMTQRDWDVYQEEVKTLSLETASRNFIKQSFEKVYSEHGIFIRLFRLDPVWSHSPGTAFQALKAVQTFMAHPGNLGPVANRLQSVLQVAELAAVCGVVGWLASAYASAEAEEDEPASWRKYREYAALLLTEHLWPFMDKLFAAEINRSITKAPLREDALEMGPVVDGVASSNAYPLVKRAMELLAMFDQAVPKERSVGEMGFLVGEVEGNWRPMEGKANGENATVEEQPGCFCHPSGDDSGATTGRGQAAKLQDGHRRGPVYDQEPAHHQE